MGDDAGDEPLEFEVEVVAVSEKAVLVRLNDDAGDPLEVWVPKSQLLPGSEPVEKGEVGPIWIPTWLARQKGIA